MHLAQKLGEKLFGRQISRLTIFCWQKSRGCRLQIANTGTSLARRYFVGGCFVLQSHVSGKRILVRKSPSSGAILPQYPPFQMRSWPYSNCRMEAIRLGIPVRLMTLLLLTRLPIVPITKRQQDVTTFCGHGRFRRSILRVVVTAIRYVKLNHQSVLDLLLSRGLSAAHRPKVIALNYEGDNENIIYKTKKLNLFEFGIVA